MLKTDLLSPKFFSIWSQYVIILDKTSLTLYGVKEKLCIFNVIKYLIMIQFVQVISCQMDDKTSIETCYRQISLDDSQLRRSTFSLRYPLQTGVVYVFVGQVWPTTSFLVQKLIYKILVDKNKIMLLKLHLILIFIM